MKLVKMIYSLSSAYDSSRYSVMDKSVFMTGDEGLVFIGWVVEAYINKGAVVNTDPPGDLLELIARVCDDFEVVVGRGLVVDVCGLMGQCAQGEIIDMVSIDMVSDEEFDEEFKRRKAEAKGLTCRSEFEDYTKSYKNLDLSKETIKPGDLPYKDSDLPDNDYEWSDDSHEEYQLPTEDGSLKSKIYYMILDKFNAEDVNKGDVPYVLREAVDKVVEMLQNEYGIRG